jgi:thioredoxin 1
MTGQELGREMSGILKSLFAKDAVEEPEPMGEAIEAPEPSAGVPAEPIHVSDDSFEQDVLASGVPVLVDFWAPWCGPCRMIAPIVEELAEKYEGRATMAKINTDENVRVAGQMGIMGIPTLILFKDGQEVDRIVGFAPQSSLEQKLQAVLD